MAPTGFTDGAERRAALGFAARCRRLSAAASMHRTALPRKRRSPRRSRFQQTFVVPISAHSLYPVACCQPSRPNQAIIGKWESCGDGSVSNLALGAAVVRSRIATAIAVSYVVIDC